jgi:pimeloyl-ACP methyl ester carboxylesterase
LREISESPLVLVGHSFGGRIAVVVASENPELVGELVLTGVPQLVRLGAPTRAPFTYRTIRWLGRHHLISESRLEAARQKYGSSDYRNAQGPTTVEIITGVGHLLPLEAPEALVNAAEKALRL